MSDQSQKPTDELEAALAALVPAAAAVDRDQMMYQAGWEAARSVSAANRPGHFWQITSGLMTAATIALAMTLVQRGGVNNAVAEATPRPQQGAAESPLVAAVPEEVAGGTPAETPAEGVAVAPAVAPAAEAASPWRGAWRFGDPASNYLALREVVLSRGVESWPAVYRDSSRTRTGPVDRSPTTNARELLDEMLRDANPPQALGEDGQPVGSEFRNQETTV